MINDLIMVCFIPVIVLIMSVLFYKFPPKKVNGLYGYRTNASTSSQKAWDEANKYAGKLQLNYSLIYISISIFLIGITIEFEDMFRFSYVTIPLGAILVCIVTSIKTEKHVKKFIKNLEDK